MNMQKKELPMQTIHMKRLGLKKEENGNNKIPWQQSL